MSAPSPSPAAMIPAHVPPDLVYDYDYLGDPLTAVDIHEGMLELLRNAPPIFYTPRNGGHWVVTGFSEISDLMRDTARISSKKMELRADSNDSSGVRMVPIMVDPPEHADHRLVLNKMFAPRPMVAMEGEVRALAAELIDKVVADGHCDFVAAVGEPLPVFVFMKLLGLPTERYHEFRDWVVGSLMTPSQNVHIEIMQKVAAMFGEQITLRAAEPREDVLTILMGAKIGDRDIRPDELMSYCLMLFVAGLDTVVNGMAFAVRHLAIDQQLQAELRTNPGLIPNAVEEILRRYTFTSPPRVVAETFDYDGVPFKEGDGVLMLLPAADLDERAFEAPTTIDLSRRSPHVAFGIGPHRCVGSHLARVELRVMYEEWLSRIPAFRLDPADPPRFHTAMVMGVERLPLRWD